MPRLEKTRKRAQAERVAVAAKCQKLTTFFGGPATSSSTSNTSETTATEETDTAESSSERSASAEPTRKQLTVSIRTATAWQREFDWLRFETNNLGLVTVIGCAYCHKKPDVVKFFMKKVGKIANIDSFVDGTHNVKNTNVRRHDGTEAHQKAKEACRVDSMVANERPLQKGFLRMSQSSIDRLQKLFDIALYVGKEEQPFTDFPKLVKLQKMHGVDVGHTYSNDKACRNFLDAIAEHEIRQPLRDFLLNKDGAFPYRYHSVLSDGSTDRNSTEKEVIYVRIVQEGRPVMKPLGLIDLENARAEGVKKGIISKYKQFLQLGDDISFSKIALIGAGADGAAVNFGIRNGLMQKIRADGCPWLVAVHCVAHRLELAIKDALKESVFSTIDGMLVSLYYFYNNSPKRMRELRAIADMERKRVVTFKKPHGTRWQAHKKAALEALLHNYDFVVKHFEDAIHPDRKDISGDDKAKMKGWRKKLLEHKFPLFLSFFLYVISQAASISEAFQADNLSLPDIMETVTACTVEIAKLPNTDGPHLKKFRESTRTIEADDEGGVTNLHFGDHTLTHVDAAEVKLGEERQVVPAKVLECLNQRFRDFNEDPLLQACCIFDPKNWPSNEQEITSYGIKQLDHMCHHFQKVLEANGCDVVKAKEEFPHLKMNIFNHHMGLSYIELWELVFKRKQHKYSNILHIVAIVLALPVSNAKLERAFSTMKRIYSDWRSRMNTSTIDTLLLISEAGPSWDNFNSKAAVVSWLVSGASRRTNRQLRGDPTSLEPMELQIVEDTDDEDVFSLDDDDLDVV